MRSSIPLWIISVIILDFTVNNILTDPASCFEIKKCSPSSNDGEYWLFPEMFDRQTPLKIYCHNMTSPETATEYLSLPKENYFIRHDKTDWKEDRVMCSRNSNPLMRTVFSKIKINITSLSIKQDDFTFANTTGVSAVENVPFGTTHDCTASKTWYYENNQTCQLFARFQIDLQGTGVAISKSLFIIIQLRELPAMKWRIFRKNWIVLNQIPHRLCTAY